MNLPFSSLVFLGSTPGALFTAVRLRLGFGAGAGALGALPVQSIAPLARVLVLLAPARHRLRAPAPRPAKVTVWPGDTRAGGMT